MKGAPNCYLCRHRRPIPGDEHSFCTHPESNPIALIAIMTHHVAVFKTGLRVAGDPYGIQSGWFLWPMNYDPLWLTECNGFESQADHVERLLQQAAEK